ncbi:MAG: ATP-grasp domain-containing protein [Kofleriaceae bacterium]|jgi:formate-dependent phosphoribosylglycinamide formyltransferase (GAR transformylase)|nr:ATP-grasp domain-containing protein [Kofleriaceae bacterium]MBP9167363.1 ATP-grasp domain-containing protein [Kofleriaceae bacterium]MBP9860780.1 ATP-grasp domain-containing protein [Kofleriaceae bacterium]
MRNVVFAAPFPLETTLRFARAAARLDGVRLLGLVQEPPRGDDARMFADLVTVADGLDTDQLIAGAKQLERRHGRLHRVLGILEPLQVQLAQVRAALGVPGADPTTADLFRDKARMKDELRRHGLPCARHALIRTWADAEAFVAEVGLPVVLKPPAGMGCKSTWRIGSRDELRAALKALHAGPDRPALAEEFLRGREYSFETITIGGQVHFESCSRYFPTPLEVMETPWIQWVVVLPRVIDGPEFADARAMGRRAVAALGLETGFTHMEWFRRDDGSLAIGEIAARPPGAHIVLATGYAHDTDLYRAWARAVIDEAFDGPWDRRYAVGVAYLRGVGRGRVSAVRGVERANAAVGHLAIESRLPRPGTPRSDSYEGDGYVVVRDPDVEVVKRAMTTIIETIQIEYA